NRLSRALPNVRLYYALKANPHVEVVKILNEAGSSFDICSIGELNTLQGLQVGNIGNGRVIYTNPTKKEGEIEFIRGQGINLFVFDNSQELQKIARFAPGSNVLLRLEVSNPHCVVNLSYKFGAEANDAEALISEAMSLGLRVKGLCFHVGSQTTNPGPYVDTIKTCKKITDRLTSRGIKLEVLDIGGGFPVSYTSRVIPIETFCEPIKEALNDFSPDIRIIAEPGRFLVGEAIVLITRVIGKSKRKNVPWYFLDDGLYNSFSGKIYDNADYDIISEKTRNKEQCVVAGPTCDSFDVISTKKVLPELEIGDLLLVPSMGAYTSCSASEFNCHKRTPTVVVD
ncbi:MAG: type III PLP-dependent enzyme, partial [Candidatus Brocadiales bacterium]